MDYDIIICAVVAVLVLAKLWSILGQRNGEERERPNPFASPFRAVPASPAPADGAPVPPKLTLAPDSLAGGLAAIKVADPAFDEKQFLQKARSVFTSVLGDFAKGDLSDSERFLTPEILANFRQAIAARNSAGQTLEHRLDSIREAECVSAKIQDGRAAISVRFVSDQETYLRDAAGSDAGGSGKVEEIIDLWTFTREVKTAGADWILSGTSS